MKFGRTYKLMIYSSPTQTIPDLIIRFPMTIKFQVSNNCLQSGNAAHFMIYNLSETTRQALYRDLFDQADVYRGILFEAGYESEPTPAAVFSGDIQWAYSYRQGVDWITEIEAIDGGMAIERAQIKLTATSTQNLEWLLTQMVKTMNPYGVTLGAIGKFDIQRSRGLAVSGSTWSELSRIMAAYQANCFINKGLVYILNQNEYIPNISPVKVLSSDTGLIGTPRRTETSLKATMVFEPRMEVGQMLRLKSDEPSVNIALANHGDYKVFDVTHAGTISGSVGGDALTIITIQLYPDPTPVPAELAA